jgi:hypothetical protein
MLPFEDKSLRDAMRGDADVTATLAFRTARLAEASIDDLLAGRYLQGACPHCGRLPDFTDEDTAAEVRPGQDGGLKLVK